MDLLSKTFFYGWPRIQNLHFEFYPRQTRGWNFDNSRFYSLQLLLLQKDKQYGDGKKDLFLLLHIKTEPPSGNFAPTDYIFATLHVLLPAALPKEVKFNLISGFGCATGGDEEIPLNNGAISSAGSSSSEPPLGYK